MHAHRFVVRRYTYIIRSNGDDDIIISLYSAHAKNTVRVTANENLKIKLWPLWLGFLCTLHCFSKLVSKHKNEKYNFSD